MARFSTAILVRGFLNELIQQMKLDGISTKNFNVEISQTLRVLEIIVETSRYKYGTYTFASNLAGFLNGFIFSESINRKW